MILDSILDQLDLQSHDHGQSRLLFEYFLTVSYFQKLVFVDYPIRL